jgi:hypothetical protein
VDIDSIRPVLSGLAGGVVALLLQRFARRAMPQATDDGTLLRYPKGLLVLGVVAFTVFFAFTVYNALGKNVVNSYAVAVSVPLVLATAAGWLAIECAGVSIVLGRDSLRCTSPWRPAREILWRDVVKASYSRTNDCYVLRTRNQGTVRVSGMLSGSDVLRDHLKANGIELE